MIPQDNNPRPSDPTLLFVAGGALLVALVVLAALWLNQRQQTLAARRACREQFQQMQLAAQRMQMTLAQPAPGPIDRAGLDAIERTVDRQPRPVLQLSAEQGQRLGLQPGDLLEVAPATPAEGN